MNSDATRDSSEPTPAGEVTPGAGASTRAPNDGYAVFLRGVNVGGINIKMADLKRELAHLPFRSFATLLATGNIACRTAMSADEIKSTVEKCLRDSFGYDAWVVVLSAVRLTEIIAACPYPADSTEQHSYITLGSDEAIIEELYTLAERLDGVEQTRLGPEATAWLAPAGGTLDSPFSKLSAKGRYKSSTTTRNLRTLMKVQDAIARL
ncbi:DUF1697 domain-containing protein [Paenarthrobacter sp. PH39-S1]|uniref:DUF1697 domain-containing protein n=1 Tax=Paenarthrobacter sp. PH39-S1 TaxID=3046204 RepID=UPI0024BBB4AB|nr:DUF1697 domain-containing protein [Paenarthrobacter sp. PH39-S1]MDJ0356547.1 DUF1697 domain-containing protein [Paenarthrobacter sp. PH39-S1]